MSDLVKRWSRAKIFNVEINRFKEKHFLMPMLSNVKLYGLASKTLYPFVYTDIYNRYYKMQGKNLMYGIMFNDISSETYGFTQDHHIIQDEIKKTYLNSLDNLGIGYDSNKAFYLSSSSVVKFYQETFLKMLNDKINIVTKTAYFDSLLLHMYNFYEVEEIGDRAFVNGEEVFLNEATYLSFDLRPYYKTIEEFLETDKISKDMKNTIFKCLGYYEYLSLELVNYKEKIYLNIDLESPEYLGGINFLVLNPSLMDVFPFVSKDEIKTVQRYLENGYQEGVFSGTTVKNPLTGADIFLFISYDFTEPIHIPNPLKDEKDKHYANYFGIDILQIIENDVLINSDFLNGLNLIEAKQTIIMSFLSEGMAEIKHDYKVKEIIMSSVDKFGIPIPLKVKECELTYEAIEKRLIPITYDRKGQVFSLQGELDFSGNLFDGSISKEFVFALSHQAVLNLDAVPLSLKKTGFNGVNTYFVSKDNLMLEYVLPRLFDKILINNENVNYHFICSKELDLETTSLYNSLGRNFCDDILKIHSADSYRLFIIMDTDETDFEATNLKIIKYEQFLNSIKSLYQSGFAEENEAFDYKIYDFVTKINHALETSNLKIYVEQMMRFFYEVLSEEKMTANQALIYLKLLSLICPFICQEIFENVFKQSYFLVYEDWPFFK